MTDPRRQPRTVLGLDFGTKRIGVAVAERGNADANPIATVAVRARGPDWEALARLVDVWQPDAFIVGRPEHADGSRHTLAPALDRFSADLERRFGVPVVAVDERLSSHEAAQRPGGDDPERVHAIAAQIILETWLRDTRAVATP